MSTTTQSLAGTRIANLLDEGSFVEIGSYVTARATNFNMQGKETPGDGVKTGYGTVNGNLVYVYSQDAAVLGGSMGEMQAKKITALYDMAQKMGAPIIGLIDCAGLRLQEATDALDAFGKLFLCQANASGVIPQITAVFGTCGGGMALVPAMTDFTFMEAEKAKLFVNAPNALDGNIVTKNDTAKAKFQAEEAGMVDGIGTEAEIMDKIRTLVSVLPANNEDDMAYSAEEDDLNRLTEGIENGAEDPVIALGQIADNGVFFEIKPDYAKEMVCGFVQLNGQTVGAVANRSVAYDAEGKAAEKYDTVLTTAGCEKAAAFVKFCDAFNIPVLTLTAVTGFKATVCEEKTIAKAAATLANTFAGATVPKINIVTGNAYGTAYVTMNAKSIGADLSFAWPQAKIGMMDATAAVKIMYADEIVKADDQVAFIKEKAAAYNELQQSAEAAAKRGYVDDIIDPAQTRKMLIASFEMLYTKRDDGPAKKHSAR